jgi:hypothetical protein
MQLARRIFIGAAIWGVLIVTPLFFMEGYYSARYGAGQPLWYYGFACVTLAWQFGYLLCGLDPVRYRPLMPIAMAAKLSFGVTGFILWQTGRTPLQLWVVTTPDLILVALFFWAWTRTPKG